MIKIFLKLFLIICLIITISSCKNLTREHFKWDENITFCDGSIVTVHHHYSDYKQYGARHGFSVGFDSDPEYEIKFFYKEKEYNWENKFGPIILNIYNENIYLVAFDRITEAAKPHFRFFKYSQDWVEFADYNQFPKIISIQNVGLLENNGYFEGKPINEKKMMEDLNPEYFPFSSSLTAKLWLQLERGTEYYNAPDDVDPEFLTEYKKKYIDVEDKCPSSQQ